MTRASRPTLALGLRFCFAVGLLYPLTWLGLLLGGVWLTLGPVCVLGSHLLLDAVTARDRRTYHALPGVLANLPLYAHLPCAAITIVLLLWQSQAGHDLGGIGALIGSVAGDWVLQAHREFDTTQKITGAWVSGLMLSANHIVAHELVHRRSERLSMAIGRWLLAANGDAQFSISHVYGHHINVGTAADAATARRGESVYRFALRSAIGQYREARRIEAQRLLRLGSASFGLHNRLLSGLLMTAALIAVAGAWAGLPGLLMLIGSMVTAKFLFENVNYIQHYGLVREAGQRVEPRHSWDCDHRWATWVFYALPRHAQHHARPVLAYWQLEPSKVPAESMQLRRGYVGSMALACLPPLWRRHTAPLLAHWDLHLANDAERRLAEAADRRNRHQDFSAHHSGAAR